MEPVGLSIDAEAGLIKNVSIMTAGPACPGNSEDFEVDDVMLSQVAQAINDTSEGIPCRVTHVELAGSPMSPPPDAMFHLAGRIRNARVVNGRCRADVALYKFADSSPVGPLRTFLLGVAEEDPRAIGMSIMFQRGEYVPRGVGETSLGRIASLQSVDFVGRPGANPNGLLSGRSKSGAPPRISGGPTMPADQMAAVQKAAKEAVAADRKRRSDIIALATQNKLPEKWATDLADRGVSVEHATELVALAVSMRPVSGIRVGDDRNIESLRDATAEAICLRAGVKVAKPHERAAKISGLGVLDMFRQHLSAYGCPDAAYLSRTKLCDLLGPRRLRSDYPEVALAMGSSDFTNILRDAINKALLKAYEEFPSQWSMWARRTSAADFKTIYRIALSEAPNLVSRTEGGEIRYVNLSDGQESYALVEYAGGLRLTRRAIINDDMDAFSRIPQMQAQAAARKEDDVAYAILTANAAMADTGALFNATAVTTAGGHANLAGVGAALSVTTLAAASAAMGLQKGPKLAAMLNLQPRWLVVPVTKRVLAEQLIGSINDPAQTVAVTNPFANKLGVIANPRLDASSTTRWYVLADTSQIDTVEVCFLQGEEAPVLKQESDFDTDDAKFAIRHTVAAKAVDWRGMYANPGA